MAVAKGIVGGDGILAGGDRRRQFEHRATQVIVIDRAAVLQKREAGIVETVHSFRLIAFGPAPLKAWIFKRTF
jgi:hypothetical protein